MLTMTRTGTSCHTLSECDATNLKTTYAMLNGFPCTIEMNFFQCTRCRSKVVCLMYLVCHYHSNRKFDREIGLLASVPSNFMSNIGIM